MFRINDAGQEIRCASQRRARLSRQCPSASRPLVHQFPRALLVPALASAVLAVAEVSSVSVQPIDIPSGSSATGTVRVGGLSAGAVAGATVTLSSSTLSVKVPPSVVVDNLLGVKTFPVTTKAGFAGCAIISAQVGMTTPKATMVFVKAPPTPGSSPVKLQLSADQVLGLTGSWTTGTVALVQTSAAAGVVVQLSSSSPTVTVPASVTVPLAFREPGVYVGSVSVPITVTTTVAAPTCSVITATGAGSQSRVLLKVLP